MRKINEIIIHCSDSPISMDIGVDTIREWHVKERGFSDVGYHYVIKLDGTIEQGRSLDKMGAHCRGRNRHSVGVCYIGGRVEDSTDPKDTRTPEQRKSLESLVKGLKIVFNISEVSPHYKYSTKTCPNFNVDKEFN